MPKLIGQSLLRREDRALLTGAGQYAGDINPPGLLHVGVVRSVYPHARIARVALETARGMPGVVGAFALSDLPEIQSSLGDPAAAGIEARSRPVLAGDKVRYVGEPIAVVVADDPARALDAVESVDVEFVPLEGVGDVDAATRPGAPVLHDDLGSNIAGRVQRAFGDIDAAMLEDAVVVRQSFRFGRVIGGYMEPRATTAALDGDNGRLTVWTSTQWVYGVRDRIASILGLDRSQVRVLAPDVGGAFGAKGQVYPEEILMAALARRLRRPVRWVATRTEDTQATGQSHGDTAEVELAANRADGTLRGLRVRLRHDVGAYGGPGLGQSDNILSHLVSAYRLPALDAESVLVYTSTVPTGFIRGGGREVGNFIIERTMDLLARELELDPAELRRRNLIEPFHMPYETGYKRMGTRPVVYDGGDYPQLLASALDGVGYTEARQRQAGGARIGIGVACCVESTGIQQPEPATIRVQPDGQVHAYLGSTPGGQGHRTTFAQVVAQHLDWPVDLVKVFVGDSDSVASSANTAGSRSALEVGNAAAAVARQARKMLLEHAQTALEVHPQDILIGPAGAGVRGAPARAVELAELVGEGLEAQETFQSGGAYTSACHAVVVEVDPDTASVDILRYAIAHDCGQAINPLLVRGQLQGGLVHGLGYALMEQVVYLPDGTLTTANLADYALPGRGLPAAIRPVLVEVHAAVLGNNPEGFKGVGETGTIAAPAAIVGAIEDALRTSGADVTLTSLPLTPTRLFSAIKDGALRDSGTVLLE
jgi:aerobic carbon-monoxide dehydrogenase large subunit